MRVIEVYWSRAPSLVFEVALSLQGKTSKTKTNKGIIFLLNPRPFIA